MNLLPIVFTDLVRIAVDREHILTTMGLRQENLSQSIVEYLQSIMRTFKT